MDHRRTTATDYAHESVELVRATTLYISTKLGESVADVFRRLRPILGNVSAQRAISILRRDFLGVESSGPGGVAEFLGDPQGGDIRADAAGSVRTLLNLCRGS